MSAHERVWNPRQESPAPRSHDGLVDLRADCGEADGDAISRVAARGLGAGMETEIGALKYKIPAA